MTVDFAPSTASRPYLMAKKHAVVSGHYWASQAGLQILEAGGNAVDAGVATSLAINVLEVEMCHFLGVAPIMIYLADRDEVVSLVGVGPWPKAVSSAFFRERFGGEVPLGILHSVVPAAPGNYVEALARYGTMSFGEVAEAAIRFARDGFPMYQMLHDRLNNKDIGPYFSTPETDAVFRPDGRVPRVGETFRQRDQAAMLQYLADEERAAAGRGRAAGLRAVHDAVYRGDVASRIVAQQQELGGFMTASDLAAFEADIERPQRVRFGDIDVYSGGPWGQGPLVLAALGILRDRNLTALGHNTSGYIHMLVEALKLAAADREQYFGDPRFVDVPVSEMLSDAYLAGRSAQIDERAAFPGMPPAGTLGGRTPPQWAPDPSSRTSMSQAKPLPLETSYLCTVDRHGNAYSSTPSDAAASGPVIKGLGLPCCTWGSRAYTAPDHPARVEGGRRPRMATNPQLAIRRGKYVMPYGSPGGEVLGQAQLQVFLNMTLFGMDPQSAVEAPRFASTSWPASMIPHSYRPAGLTLEGRIGQPVGDQLAAMGHAITWWPERHWQAGSVNVILHDLADDVRYAGADHRRTAYAAGW
jgi:gamma-glutamyltranspeptidase/glutathione hydrolase